MDYWMLAGAIKALGAALWGSPPDVRGVKSLRVYWETTLFRMDQLSLFFLEQQRQQQPQKKSGLPQTIILEISSALRRLIDGDISLSTTITLSPPEWDALISLLSHLYPHLHSHTPSSLDDELAAIASSLTRFLHRLPTSPHPLITERTCLFALQSVCLRIVCPRIPPPQRTSLALAVVECHRWNDESSAAMMMPLPYKNGEWMSCARKLLSDCFEFEGGWKHAPSVRLAALEVLMTDDGGGEDEGSSLLERTRHVRELHLELVNDLLLPYLIQTVTGQMMDEVGPLSIVNDSEMMIEETAETIMTTIYPDDDDDDEIHLKVSAVKLLGLLFRSVTGSKIHRSQILSTFRSLLSTETPPAIVLTTIEELERNLKAVFDDIPFTHAATNDILAALLMVLTVEDEIRDDDESRHVRDRATQRQLAALGIFKKLRLYRGKVGWLFDDEVIMAPFLFWGISEVKCEGSLVDVDNLAEELAKCYATSRAAAEVRDDLARVLCHVTTAGVLPATTSFWTNVTSSPGHHASSKAVRRLWQCLAGGLSILKNDDNEETHYRSLLTRLLLDALLAEGTDENVVSDVCHALNVLQSVLSGSEEEKEWTRMVFDVLRLYLDDAEDMTTPVVVMGMIIPLLFVLYDLLLVDASLVTEGDIKNIVRLTTQGRKEEEESYDDRFVKLLVMQCASLASCHEGYLSSKTIDDTSENNNNDDDDEVISAILADLSLPSSTTTITTPYHPHHHHRHYHDIFATDEQNIRSFPTPPTDAQNTLAWLFPRETLLVLLRIGDPTTRFRGHVELTSRSPTRRRRVLVSLTTFPAGVRDPDFPPILWSGEMTKCATDEKEEERKEEERRYDEETQEEEWDATSDVLSKALSVIKLWDESQLVVDSPPSSQSQSGVLSIDPAAVATATITTAERNDIMGGDWGGLFSLINQSPNNNNRKQKRSSSMDTVSSFLSHNDPNNNNNAALANAAVLQKSFHHQISSLSSSSSSNDRRRRRRRPTCLHQHLQSLFGESSPNIPHIEDELLSLGLSPSHLHEPFVSTNNTATTTSSSSSPHPLSPTPAFLRALSILDRSSPLQTHKIALLYTPSPVHLSSESTLLEQKHPSPSFLKFQNQLGDLVLTRHLNYFSGGMDTSKYVNDGEFTLLGMEENSQRRMVLFHNVMLMPEGVNLRKRHVGNDAVHIVYVERDDGAAGGDRLTESPISGQFGFVTIYVIALRRSDDDAPTHYRVAVRIKSRGLDAPAMRTLSRLETTGIVPAEGVGRYVMRLAVRADVACLACLEARMGLLSNWEERVLKIREMKKRYLKKEWEEEEDDGRGGGEREKGGDRGDGGVI